MRVRVPPAPHLSKPRSSRPARPADIRIAPHWVYSLSEEPPITASVQFLARGMEEGTCAPPVRTVVAAGPDCHRRLFRGLDANQACR